MGIVGDRGDSGAYPDIDLVLEDLGLVEYTHSLHSIHRGQRSIHTHRGHSSPVPV